MNQENATNFDIFLCYYSGTGIDFSRFLRKRLDDFGISAFLDEIDISKSVKKDVDKWREIIDNALLNSDKFVLIMTLNFNIRREVLREIELALLNKKEMIYCKHQDLPDSELIINIKDEIIDLAEYQYISFKDEPDLLRKLGAKLLGLESMRKKESIFIENVRKIINSEGLEVRLNNKPMIEMIIGPSYEPYNWIEITPEYRDLISISSILCKDIIARRNSFECDTYYDTDYYKVHINGFFHGITSMRYDDKKNLYYIELTIAQILNFFISCLKIMKYKSISSDQSIYIVLRNIKDINMLYGPLFGSSEFQYMISIFRRNVKNFSKDVNEVEFSYQFNPNEKWSDLINIIKSLYKDLCLELGIIDLKNSEIDKRICEMLRHSSAVNDSFNLTHIKMKNISLEEFECLNVK